MKIYVVFLLALFLFVGCSQNEESTELLEIESFESSLGQIEDNRQKYEFTVIIHNPSQKDLSLEKVIIYPGIDAENLEFQQSNNEMYFVEFKGSFEFKSNEMSKEEMLAIPFLTGFEVMRDGEVVYLENIKK